MNLFEIIKKNIKILTIKKDYVIIGIEKGFWSKELEFGNKKEIRKRIIIKEQKL